MPELPEVEAMRKLLYRHAVGRKIRGVVAREAGGGPRDGKFDGTVIGDGVKERDIVGSLTGRKVSGAKRFGKQLLLELHGPGPHLLLHCGMTGSLAVDGVKRFSYQGFSVDECWPPRFTKLQLLLTPGNVKIAFVDPRRFGRLLLRRDPLNEPPIRELAPDPLTSPPPLKAFAKALAGSKTPVKALLLDQTKVVCGVGNWVADEVLHRARVHPETLANALSPRQVCALRSALLHVLQRAVKVDADASRFPKGWLFHHRWRVGPGGAGVKLPNGHVLQFLEVGGRTTALVPSLQVLAGRPRGAAAETRRKGKARLPRRAAASSSPRPAPSKRTGTRKRPAAAAGAEGRRQGPARKRRQ